MLIDLRSKGVTGKQMAQAMDIAGLVCNSNSVPNDDRKPFDPSGIRLGTASITTRRFKEDEARRIGRWISDIADDPENSELLEKIAVEVKALCKEFPIPETFV